MARSYPHKQTIIIFIICVIGVAGTAAYARTQPVITENISPKQYVPDTLTDQFGKNFFARFMLLQQGELTEDPDSIKKVIDQSLDEMVREAPMPQTYGKKDIVIIGYGDPSSQKTYANAVGATFHLYMPKQDAATIATEALEDNELEKLAAIDDIIRAYEALLRGLLAIPTPENLSAYHVGLVNGASSMLFVSQGMRKISTDPIQGLVALSMYASAQESMRIGLLQLGDHFSQAGVTFSNTEPGILFTQIMY